MSDWGCGGRGDPGKQRRGTRVLPGALHYEGEGHAAVGAMFSPPSLISPSRTSVHTLDRESNPELRACSLGFQKESQAKFLALVSHSWWSALFTGSHPFHYIFLSLQVSASHLRGPVSLRGCLTNQPVVLCHGGQAGLPWAQNAVPVAQLPNAAPTFEPLALSTRVLSTCGTNVQQTAGRRSGAEPFVIWTI